MIAASRSMRAVRPRTNSTGVSPPSLGPNLSVLSPAHSLPSSRSTLASSRSIEASRSAARAKECYHISPILLPQVIETLQSHGLELREQIGSGGYGSVYTVWHASYQQMLVVKISDVGDASWLGEMETLKSIYHPHIVKLYDTFQDETFGYMLLEYCTGGNLNDKIKSTGPLSFREFRDVAYQLLDALNCCHTAGIAHLDIKPANVFYTEEGKIRLGDFGCSRFGREDNFFVGSRPFMSPEIVCQVGSFNKLKSDIWSLGVTFYFMAAGKLPWKGTSADAIRAEIRIGAYVPLEQDVDPRIPPLIRSMMKLEASQRASLASLMEVVGSWPAPSGPSRRVLALFGDGSPGSTWRVRSRRPLSRSFPEISTSGSLTLDASGPSEPIDE